MVTEKDYNKALLFIEGLFCHFIPTDFVELDGARSAIYEIASKIDLRYTKTEISSGFFDDGSRQIWTHLDIEFAGNITRHKTNVLLTDVEVQILNTVKELGGRLKNPRLLHVDRSINFISDELISFFEIEVVVDGYEFKLGDIESFYDSENNIIYSEKKTEHLEFLKKLLDRKEILNNINGAQTERPKKRM